MPWPVHPTGFFGARGDQDTYKIERSLRFNSADSAYLNRTFGTPTNQNVWTLSVWIKGTSLTSASIMGVTTTGYELIFFDSTNALRAETWINTPPIQSRNQKTNAIFRDPSAWYHFVISKNGSWTSGYPYTIYLNGISQSLTTFNLNTNFVDRINTNGSVHQIGADGSAGTLFNGYMAEFYFIDGQALTPSSFGETDPITGRWKAKRYAGTYGTNGFYLNFADNSGTTSTTLGKDSSGNGNNWTPNNFSVTAGAGNDSLLDSPTDSGASGNYATLDPIGGSTLSIYSNGNLQVSGSGANAGNFGASYSNIGVRSGKWYAEFTYLSGGANASIIGVGSHIYTRGTANQNGIINGITSINLDSTTAAERCVYENGTALTGGDASFSFSVNDIIGVAFDAGARTVNFYKNGSILGSTYPYDVASVGAGDFYFIACTRVSSGTSSFAANFGQRPFAYTAPTGFKALCTTNLPTPTIRKPSSYMDVVTYTGNGVASGRSIATEISSPDLVWIKSRSLVSNHFLFDSVRGATNVLGSNQTIAEYSNSDFGLGSGNFTIGDNGGTDDYNPNKNSATYVAWAWDEAPIAGMDIVSYTGNGANRTISHNLGVAPKMMIVRNRDSSVAQNWQVYHANLTSAAFRLRLNTTDAQDSVAGIWNSTAPTSSVFSVGTETGVNENGKNFIAYLFAEVEGFSKFGSYTGNGSSDGPFVWCGFRPRWVMAKSATGAYNWHLYDAVRNTANVCDSDLLPNSSSAEVTASPFIDILSNGFKVRASDIGFNGSGATFIFAAFAESPFKYARAR